MKQKQHVLHGLSLGTEHAIHSLHFGQRQAGQKKAYLQAGLHAGELPGMLVLHYLRQYLAEAEAAGRLQGEVVLVPVANPIGLDQTVLGYQMGRFDLASGENFNRGFPVLAPAVAKQVAPLLGSDAERNIQLVRQALQQQLLVLPAVRPVDHLRKILLSLACDADLVLDLHCDCESALHLYTHTACLEQILPLSALMQAHATLYAKEQGGNSFDEITASFWLELQAQLPQYPLPLPTTMATVELRGQLDISHQQAQSDAQQLLQYLSLQGLIQAQSPQALPPLKYPATPLEGSEVLYAQQAGVIVYLAECGDWLSTGTPVVDIINPIDGTSQRLCAGTDGVLFARQNRRYATAGMDLAYIAGSVPIRSGHLLSA